MGDQLVFSQDGLDGLRVLYFSTLFFGAFYIFVVVCGERFDLGLHFDARLCNWKLWVVACGVLICLV